ncbi:MAG: hypothetical protein JO108_09715 [Acidobacteriaceae bacterium]|nr:hypothetical protein [Acidobacteriaceae bacterium]
MTAGPCALPALIVALSVPVFSGPRLIYIKSFPGSVPPYVSVVLDHTGTLEYKESPTDEQPVKTQLPETDTAQLFGMAEKLDFFKTPLESGLKVANTGKKTFRYEAEDGTRSEQVFNYSQNPLASQLLDRFEQIASSERAYIDLDRTVHFDKLGVNDALAQIEALWLNKQLAAPQQFIPLLTRISTHDTFMHLVRDRAARLKEEFQKPATNDAAAGKRGQ